MSREGALRVIQVTDTLEPIAGGVPAVVLQLSGKLAQTGVAVEIAHVSGDPGELPHGVEAFGFPATGLAHLWSFGRGLRKGVVALLQASRDSACVVHVHGVWAAPQYFGARAALQADVPFIVSAHGMLEPWLWDRQGWKIRTKKRLYWKSLAYPALSKASVIHAITPLERDHLARLFPGNRIEIIPNAIDVGESPSCTQGERCKTILFLGRIEPKKGVDLLLRAFGSAKIGSEWSLDVVGPSWSDAYLDGLRAMVSELELEARVRFRGPLFGDGKQQLLNDAWVLAVPSYSEVVGLVNLEAAVRCLPSITTHETGLYDWELGGGLLIEPLVDTLTRALEAACGWSAQERYERGLASRRLVQQRYSWQAVLPAWRSLYSSL